MPRDFKGLEGAKQIETEFKASWRYCLCKISQKLQIQKYTMFVLTSWVTVPLKELVQNLGIFLDSWLLLEQ